MTMYDRDLRNWYRELFLHASPRRGLRRRPAGGPRDAGALHQMSSERSAYEGFPLGSDIPALNDHDRQQLLG
jgi:hypothetical protein